jgi:DNA-binding transcriptional ArsR family regulator
MLHQYHLHQTGLTQDELDEALERLRGDGITHEQRPGSLPFLELLEEVRQLHLSKSQDYGSESDPLANIRQGAEFVGIEAWRGCMVRVADKVQRLKTFCRTGRLVHEGVRDTLLDLAAYSLLAIVLFDEGKNA